MKIYAIRNIETGDYIRLGRAKKYTWFHFPTNVMKHNIPEQDMTRYVVDEFDLHRMEPYRTYNHKRKKLR